VTAEIQVSTAGSVATDAQAALSESDEEALPLATADDSVSLDTTDVSDDADAEISWQTHKRTSHQLTISVNIYSYTDNTN